MGIAGAGGGAADALTRIIAEQLLQQQQALREQQHADSVRLQEAGMAQRGQIAEREAGQRQQQIDLSEMKRRDDNNARGLDLMRADKQAMDLDAGIAGLPPHLKPIAGLFRAGQMTKLSPDDMRDPAVVRKEKLEDVGAEAEARAKATAKYRDNTPSASDYEWVIGADGVPREIRKGTAQPGDRPHRATSNIENAQDRQRNARVGAARDFLTRLNSLREGINTKMGPEAGLGGLVRRGSAAVGMDPDVAEYQRIRAAGGRALAVAIMGAQNLSDQDAQAWANMLPDATTDKETAKRLTDQVETMLNGMTGAEPASAATPAPAQAPAEGTMQKPIPGIPGAIAESTDGGKTWRRVK